MPTLREGVNRQTPWRRQHAVSGLLRSAGCVRQANAEASGSHACRNRNAEGFTPSAVHSGLSQTQTIDLIFFDIKMQEAITFTIPGDPVAKGRARSFVRNGHVAHYTPEKTARYENLVRLAAQQAMGDVPPTDGAVGLIVRAFMGIPKSWSQKKQRAAALGEIVPTKRPDLDNIVKAIKDGANGVTWRDDSQVIDVRASKRYGMPRVEVEVRVF